MLNTHINRWYYRRERKLLKGSELIDTHKRATMPIRGLVITLLVLLAILAGLSCAMAYELPSDNAVVDAIYKAEGGNKTRYPYGIKSIPCKTEQKCREICLNSVRNAKKRWIKAGSKGDFIEFMSRRYCPINAPDDNGTNKFWSKNVKYFLAKGE